MRHETFPLADCHGDDGAADDGATDDGADLGLSRLVATLDDRFIPAGLTLGRLVEAVVEVLHGLDLMESAFGEDSLGEAATRLLDASEQLRQAPVRQVERAGRITALHTVIASLNARSEDVARVLTVLEFYTVNLKIAAAGEGDFVEFAQDMRAKLVDGGRLVQDFQHQVALLQKSLHEMKGVDAVLTRECERVIPAVPDRLASEVARLQGQRQRLSASSEATRALVLSLQAGIGEALGALQIGDIARQRIEHVSEGIAMLAEEPALQEDGGHQAARGHFLALLAALLGDAGREFGAETGHLRAALRALTPDCDALLASDLQSRAIAAGGDFLHTMEACIAEAHTMSHQLQVADDKAGSISQVVLGVVNALRERVQVIEDLRLEVDYMAINVNIRARREAAVGRPVAVIADAIRLASQDLATLTARVNDAAGELGAISETLESDCAGIPGESAGHALSAALAAIGTCAEQADSAKRDVSHRAGEVVGMLRDTIRDLGVAESLSRRLDAAAAQLTLQAEQARAGASGASEHESLEALLMRLGARYSMASERIIHDGFLLPGMEPLAGAAPAPGGFGGDDDDLFANALF